jgi:hypothetical protein
MTANVTATTLIISAATMRVFARSAFSRKASWRWAFPIRRNAAHGDALRTRALGHTYSVAHSLIMSSLTFFLLNDVEACRAVAEELQPIAERNKFAWPLTHMRFMRGWLTVQQGNVDAGVEQMRKAADEPSSAAIRTLLLTLTATQQLQARHYDAAVATLDHAMNDTRVRFYEAEAVRLRGDILLAKSPDSVAEAEATYREALTLAARQSNRAAELRASTSLARLLSERGRKTEARDLLAPVYAAFTEGFDKQDLMAAKTLLAELS